MYRSTFVHLHTEYAPPAQVAAVAPAQRTRSLRRPRLDLRLWARRPAQTGC